MVKRTLRKIHKGVIANLFSFLRGLVIFFCFSFGARRCPNNNNTLIGVLLLLGAGISGLQKEDGDDSMQTISVVEGGDLCLL